MSIEGKRSSDGSLSDYKRGCAVLAIHTAATVIPLFFRGHRDCLPRYGEWRVRPGTMEVKVCRRIETKGMTMEDRFALTDRLRQIAEREAGMNPRL